MQFCILCLLEQANNDVNSNKEGRNGGRNGGREGGRKEKGREEEKRRATRPNILKIYLLLVYKYIPVYSRVLSMYVTDVQ